MTSQQGAKWLNWPKIWHDDASFCGYNQSVKISGWSDNKNLKNNRGGLSPPPYGWSCSKYPIWGRVKNKVGATDVNNYRGITLTPLCSKLRNKMLLLRIRPHLDPILCAWRCHKYPHSLCLLLARSLNRFVFCLSISVIYCHSLMFVIVRCLTQFPYSLSALLRRPL